MELVQLFKEQMVEMVDQEVVLETLVVEVVEQPLLVVMVLVHQVLVELVEQEHQTILIIHAQLMLVVAVEV
jgi:hypothetical protein